MTSDQKNLAPPESSKLKATENQANPSSAAHQSQSPTSAKLTWREQIRENVQIVAIALVLALLIRSFIAEPRYIPSDSMIPTLATGDRLVVEKISSYFHPPTRGDIIVFEPPPQLQRRGYSKDQAFIKRVIGTPGEIVQVQNGQVYLNGTPLEEDYIAQPPAYNMPPVQVPEGQLFVMGDNRNNSNDSHVWGFLPQPNIIGKAIWRFWPPHRIGNI
ncbi:MAG TPA: signal peptidase I [Cyanobacteria bacterium UBA11149]|nr:signal peptidase I [Cyanobacteria bacterium UBA11367]HBE59002.1 signal peptidase I [Cyanobacteria bacterium UBA11366]HBK62762.1 signal peptidase I [Cyanobacteria bacterium UBA11166]HBR76933.1 signal peptidase I [Cyanobacteria bacterium UBA11159]HBS68321.1 signal peptidase I [Cyanobacteria bacterium UBA11153]HBW91074.1 signal peptidase I [Cyanobacteria bacterium UBA11149]HCA94726.1 signal peptidase I [Cyanobacteria bacterium UBA9226]